MVPAQKILDTAREVKADLIGLSGLITPSLEEMSHVGARCSARLHPAAADRRPTTSRAHRAEDRPALSASRRGLGEGRQPRGRRGAVAGVAGTARRFKADRGERLRRNPRTPSQPRRSRAAGVAGEGARAENADGDWANYCATRPKQPGLRPVFDDYPLAELMPLHRLDAVLQTWELAGRYPAILDDAVVGEAREACWPTRRRCWKRSSTKMVAGEGGDRPVPGRIPSATTSLRPRADEGSPRKRCHRHFPTLPEERAQSALHFLRQQDRQSRSNARTSAGRFHRAEGQRQGGLDRRVRGHRRASASRKKARRALRGRPRRLQRHPVEGPRRPPGGSLAEWHAPARAHRVLGLRRRRGAGGRGDDRRKYRGIRPAPGYPACPEHSEKATLFDMLDAPGNAGMSITESFSDAAGGVGVGLVFQPSAQPVLRGRAGLRRNRSRITRGAMGRQPRAGERWLAANLDYDPE